MTARRVRVAGATVPGAKHLRIGRPNQDAVRWLPAAAEGDRVVMAVADGHGSPASPRSGLGATIAVDIATDVLWRTTTPMTEAVMGDAVSTILGRWTAQVLDHLAHHPLPDLDADHCPPDRPTVAYGATLLFAVVSLAELALAQLGDGDVVVVDDTGVAVRPLPPDLRLMAHETTSLCDIDPVGNVRSTILDAARSRLVLLATDGYANSFRDDAAFLQVGPDLLQAADTQGISAISAALPGWLTETTRDGAGDDIGVTIAVLDRSPAVKSRSPARPARSPRSCPPSSA